MIAEPSHDLAAEQAVLGAMLQSPAACDDVTGILRDDSDFYRPAHQHIYEAVLCLLDAGERPDALLVLGELQRLRLDGKTGGGPYLHELLEACPVAVSAAHYARIVRGHADRRRLDHAGQQIRQIAAEPGLEAADRADQAHQVLADATGDSAIDGPMSLGEVLPGVLGAAENPDQHRGIGTGLADLDAVIVGGLRPGQLVVVGARPATGKTVVLLQLAAFVAFREAVPVLFATLEMSRDECVQRLVAAKAGVSLAALVAGKLTDPDWTRIRDVQAKLAAAPLFFDDNPSANLHSIRAGIRHLTRGGTPPGLVAVDYLQLMTGPRKAENRQQEVSDLSRGLKLIARDHQVPVIAASQLNRSPEARSDKRPLLADLRESGSLEQDADKVILLHRDDIYDPDSPRAGQIDMHVAKNRNGPTGMVTAVFRGDRACIASMARQVSNTGARYEHVKK